MLALRKLRYDVGRPGYRTRSVTLVTTLLDAEAYPPETLAALYGMRWRVELYLRHLKTMMKMDVLKCQTVAGVLKELTVYALVYNLVRVVMLEAARRQGQEVERVSFVDALRWLADAAGDGRLPRLVVNPDRPGRVEPRVVKRRPKKYRGMTRTRAEWRKRLMHQQLLVSLMMFGIISGKTVRGDVARLHARKSGEQSAARRSALPAS
ncbi:MAG: transposase [Isosphaeraceae bacterium]|nr:transposase [Isosphaeraceae bacterium]